MEILGVYPDVAVRANKLFTSMLEQHEMPMRVTQGYRSIAEQDALYALGRSVPGSIVTHAHGGQSFHNYGLAFDACFQGPDPYLEKNPRKDFLWTEYGRFAKVYGLEWGGDFHSFKDIPHCQMSYGFSLDGLMKMVAKHGLEGLWEVISQKITVA